jgi:hypothetical protein
MFDLKTILTMIKKILYIYKFINLRTIDSSYICNYKVTQCQKYNICLIHTRSLPI